MYAVSDRTRSLAARVGVVLTVAVGVAACGSSSSSSSSSSTSASSPPATQAAANAAVPTDLTAAVNHGYKGTWQSPPRTAPTPTPGKNVWIISCGQLYAPCQQLSSSAATSAKLLGWKTTLVDGKAAPSTANALISQAIAAKADGIMVEAFDCPGIKSGLLAAQAAKIPVVTTGSLDCNQAPYHGASLYTATLKWNNQANVGTYFYNQGVARADYLIDKIGAKGTVINLQEVQQGVQQYQNQGFSHEMAAECTQCKLVNVPWTFAEVPTQATAIWKAAMQQNPDAVAIANGVDAIAGLGLLQAMQESGTKAKLYGGEGGVANTTLISKGEQQSAVFVPYGWFGWGMTDMLERIFAGVKPAQLPSEGGGFQYIDKTHNLPPAGQAFTPSMNFEAVYKKAWGLG
jgi:ribose transport system substrate-binding protein